MAKPCPSGPSPRLRVAENSTNSPQLWRDGVAEAAASGPAVTTRLATASEVTPKRSSARKSTEYVPASLIPAAWSSAQVTSTSKSSRSPRLANLPYSKLPSPFKSHDIASRRSPQSSSGSKLKSPLSVTGSPTAIAYGPATVNSSASVRKPPAFALGPLLPSVTTISSETIVLLPSVSMTLTPTAIEPGSTRPVTASKPVNVNVSNRKVVTAPSPSSNSPSLSKSHPIPAISMPGCG